MGASDGSDCGGDAPLPLGLTQARKLDQMRSRLFELVLGVSDGGDAGHLVLGVVGDYGEDAPLPLGLELEPNLHQQWSHLSL